MTMKGKSAGEQFSEMFKEILGEATPKGITVTRHLINKNYGDTELR